MQEGLQLLSLLNDDQYTKGFKPAFQSDIGTHFRHILEHYQCFFNQLKGREFRFDKRPRDGRLETDIDYAKSCVIEFIGLFQNLDISLFEHDYTIAEQYSDDGANSDLICNVKTTLERELMFMQSHTVHHYAMIAAMTRSLGISPDEEFGVAIPTRNFTKQIDQENRSCSKKVGS